MTPEERNTALNRIMARIPEVVFERFIMVLTQVDGANNDRLVGTLSRLCTNGSYSFGYVMNTGETVETITPIREIIDLLEGWILTATVNTEHDRVYWHIQSIIGKVKY